MLFYCSECLHCANLKIMLWLRLLVQKDACWEPAWQKISSTLQVRDCSPQSLLSHSRLTDYITQTVCYVTVCLCCKQTEMLGIILSFTTGIKEVPAAGFQQHAYTGTQNTESVCISESTHMCMHHATVDVTEEISGICECYEHWNSVCSGFWLWVQMSQFYEW